MDIKHGFAFKGEFFSEQPTTYQLTTPGNFAIGGGFQSGKSKFYNGPILDDYVLKVGDLLVTMTDLSKAADTLGYAAKVPPEKGVVWLHNQRVGLVKAKTGAQVSEDFLHYLMRSPSYRHSPRPAPVYGPPELSLPNALPVLGNSCPAPIGPSLSNRTWAWQLAPASRNRKTVCQVRPSG